MSYFLRDKDHSCFFVTGLYSAHLKRVLDVFIALAALFMLAPLLFFIFVAIKITAPGPALFRHKRVRRDGETFVCYKFRTMVLDAEEQLEALLKSDPELAREFKKTNKLVNDPRINGWIGTFLRTSSLDEIPQFFNVLRGDMSIVGPRPVTSAELEDYGAARSFYLSVRPGITGIWQVSGRSDVTFDERVKMDCRYVTNITPRNDLVIILRTFFVVLVRRGAH